MPCDSVRTTSIEFAKVDLPTLAKALRAAGWQLYQSSAEFVHACKDGIEFALSKGSSRATITKSAYRGVEDEVVAANVRVAYGKQVVKQGMDRFGFKLKSSNETGTKLVFGRKG